MEIKNKLFFLVASVIILVTIRNNKSNFENLLIRYIKFNRKNISIRISEKKLLLIINYIKSLKEGELKKNSYHKLNKPKISFISPVFNQANYLSTFISSVQRQKLKEYELIFIDDFSKDQSVKFIKEKKKEDQRIKLIKNRKNMGTLYSRYIGQKLAISIYSLFLDCDDIVLEDGIFNSYKHIKKYHLDIVQFLTVWQDINSIYLKTNIYKYSRIIYKPILSYIFYYDSNYHKGNELNYALWDKLVKTKILNKAFDFIGYNYIKKNIIIQNDLIVLFAIFQMANSYHYTNEIGYYYIRNNKNSTINSWNNKKIKTQIIISLFLSVEFLYEKTKDTYLDKYFCIFKIKSLFKIYNQLFYNLNNEEYCYIKNIIDKILNLDYLSNQDKLMLSNIELFILNMKKP